MEPIINNLIAMKEDRDRMMIKSSMIDGISRREMIERGTKTLIPVEQEDQVCPMLTRLRNFLNRVIFYHGVPIR